MFSRIVWENYQILFPVIGFFLIAGGFLYFLFRAIRMKRDRVDYMSHLPLEKEEKRPVDEKNKDSSANEPK